MDTDDRAGPASRRAGPSTQRILLVHGSHRFDGHRMGFLQYVEALRSAGTPVDVVTCVDPSSADDFAVDGSAVVGRRVPPGGQFEAAVNRFFGVYARRLAHEAARVVHVNDVYLSNFARYRTNVVVHVADLAKLHTRYYPWASSWLHNRMLTNLPRAAAIVTESKWVRADVEESLRFAGDRIVVAYPRSPLPPPPEPFPRPAASPTEDHPWRLLYVAVDRPHKNVEMFLRVLRALGPRYRGVFVGRLRPSTEALARDLGVRDRLEVRSDVPDLVPVYRTSHILLHPSRYEGLGFPLLEAMSQGVPVVASRVTCLPEILGTGGETVPPDDLAGWVHAVESRSEPAAYAAAQRAALQRSTEFTLAGTAASLERAYEIAGRR